MSAQLGAQFAFSQPPGSPGVPFSGGDVLDTTQRRLASFPGGLRLGQTLYVIIEATNNAPVGRQLWVMPWWLHPTFEFRYPGQGQYTPLDLSNFGPQALAITLQDSLWMTSPKRLDIIGAPSPAGTSISDMQSDIWAIDLPANGSVKKSFFYPSHGYGLAITYQVYEVVPNPGTVSFAVIVTPGAMHASFQDGQG